MISKALTMIVLVAITTSASASASASAKSSNCEDLQIGESKRINISNVLSRSGVEFKYTLKKSAEDTYDVFINYNLDPSIVRKLFGRSDGGDNSKYKKNFQACFDKYNDKLEDGNGRKLRLNVYDENKHSDIQRPPKVGIAIVGEDERSHSRAYAKDVGCSTIIHEAFHLLGLPDEYEERWMAWNPHFLQRVVNPLVTPKGRDEFAFDCRSQGSNTSVMNNPHELNYFNTILHSKHIDMVIYPNCKKKNKTFFQCSKNAYRTSKEHGGVLGCKDVPVECSNGEWYGR